MVTGSGTGAIFDLGHADEIETLVEANGRLVSRDLRGGWVLWDLATKSLVARGTGDQYSDVAMAGAVFMMRAANAIELRDAGDGHLITSLAQGQVTDATSFGVATDGSYVWVRSDTDVQVWSPAGAHLFTHPGSYAYSAVFAAPGELRIGGYSSQTIEYVNAATGTSTNSPTFAGTFHSWFLDGERFFTAVGDTWRIFSKDAVQAAIFTSPTSLTGRGDYFWSQFSLYAVAQPSVPLQTLATKDNGYTRVSSSGNLISLWTDGGGPNLTIVHLDAGGVSTETVSMPSANLSAFTADSAGNWSVGTRSGVVYDSANLLAKKGPLSCGKVFAIDGSETGLAVVGTDGGGVLTFQAGAQGFTFQGAVPYKGSRVQVSDDGTVLAVQYDADAQYWKDMSLRVFSLPGATEIHSWPLQYDPAASIWNAGISLSRGGTQIGQVQRNTSTGKYTRMVTDLTGSTTTFKDTIDVGWRPSVFADAPFFVSPDGTLVATVDNTGFNTQIFKNGMLIDATPGRPSGWIDNDRFLVQFYELWGQWGGPDYKYTGTAIHTVSTGTTGAKTTALDCTELGFGVVDANHVNCDDWIYDLSTGAAVWKGSGFDHGAVAGGYVVSAGTYDSTTKTYDPKIYAQAYTLP
jgi:hypothetical protein